MEKLRVFEAFAGYGSQSMALKRLDMPFEVVGISEIDKYAIQAYMAVHGETPNYGDICKIDWLNVPDFDLFTYSFPCGLKGTMIDTIDGQKDISEITLSDKVLTHNNRYQSVVRTMSRISQNYYVIKTVGATLKLTGEHPLYVMRNNEIQWIKVKNLKISDKLAYNIPNTTTKTTLSNEYLWLLGRYVSDGFINKKLYNSVLFAIGNKKESEFLSNIPQVMVSRFKTYQKSCIEYRIADLELQTYCKDFGCGAKNKIIPQWVIDLPKEQLQCFINGYISGDGHIRHKSGTKIEMFSTVSKKLYLGLQKCYLKLANKSVTLSVRVDSRKETFNNSYNGQIAHSNKSIQCVCDDKVFVPIRNIDFIEDAVPVYNMEVANDNSYTCDNIITHNCTDISSAGQQKGLAKGSGTRSGLLWECERAIEIKRPKYLLMENVKALVESKFIDDFLEWQNILSRLGYSNFSKVLNALDFGVPQNRERIFMVSILGQEWFNFPEATKLDRCLGDVLEDDMDNNFFLSSKLVDGFLRHKQNSELKGRGFKFIPRDIAKEATCISTQAGARQTDNFIIQRARGFNKGGEFNVSPTITSNAWQENNFCSDKTYIRKLTPRECFRLMDVSEGDIDKIQSCFTLPERVLSYSKEERQRYIDSLTKEQLAKKGISQTQQYKMAGNSIVVAVLEKIFEQMFFPKQRQATLFG